MEKSSAIVINSLTDYGYWDELYWRHDVSEEAKNSILIAKQIFNKKLTTEYPFLIFKDNWTGETSKDYDYSFTLIDDLPRGWMMAFGDNLLKELKQELLSENLLEEYSILQIKEKYGGLRWYDHGGTDKWYDEILPKYEKMSFKTCIYCGKPAKWISKGWWITPYCNKCKIEAEQRELKELKKVYTQFAPIEEVKQ